jgi:iron complex transport system substrate-binding protein
MAPVKAGLAALAALIVLWAGPARALELTDDAGRVLKWDKPFTRIVSLYGAHAENLVAMGAASCLVGISEAEPGLPALPELTARDGAERIAALKPDLVLARPMHFAAHPELIRQLEALNIAVACLQPKTPQGLDEYWLNLGRLTGHENEAKAMAERFATEARDLAAKTSAIPAQARKKVFLEAIHSQMKTVSPGSMAAYVLEMAGAVNLAGGAEPVSGSSIAYFGLERVMALGDDLDFYLAQLGPMNPVTRQDIMTTGGLAGLKAVREGRVCLLDEGLMSRPTPRLIQAAKMVAAILYPDLFNKKDGN